jgi:hypothetical protein
MNKRKRAMGFQIPGMQRQIMRYLFVALSRGITLPHPLTQSSGNPARKIRTFPAGLPVS